MVTRSKKVLQEEEDGHVTRNHLCICHRIHAAHILHCLTYCPAVCMQPPPELLVANGVVVAIGADELLHRLRTVAETLRI